MKPLDLASITVTLELLLIATGQGIVKQWINVTEIYYGKQLSRHNVIFKVGWNRFVKVVYKKVSWEAEETDCLVYGGTQSRPFDMNEQRDFEDMLKDFAKIKRGRKYNGLDEYWIVYDGQN